MKDIWTPILLCHPEDAKGLLDLTPTANLVSVTIGGEKFGFNSEGDLRRIALTANAIVTDAIAYVATSPRGEEHFKEFTRVWVANFGEDAAIPFYMWDKKDSSTMINQILSSQIAATHQRNTRLMREIGLLRAAHDEIQTSFQQLESFYYSNNNATRILSRVLPVHRTHRPQALSEGIEIVQRLPVDSSGLSDVCVWVEATRSETGGGLLAALELHESGEIVGEWDVPAEDIEPGWLRFSLDRALSSDRQSLSLRLTWAGEAEILLGSSFYHPDKRFMPQDGAPVLAMEIWKYIPGARALFPANGTPIRKRRAIDRWGIGANLLKTAVGLNPDRPDAVAYSDEFSGLMVSPNTGTPTVARVDRAVRSGTRHLSGGVKIEDSAGPSVEFAYGLYPSEKRRKSQKTTPKFVDTMVSEWLCLQPGEWSELHLPLATELDVDHDLFLMTRLADPAAETAASAYFYHAVGYADPDGTRAGVDE